VDGRVAGRGHGETLPQTSSNGAGRIVEERVKGKVTREAVDRRGRGRGRKSTTLLAGSQVPPVRLSDNATVLRTVRNT
jgi:hypothetical protein